MKVIRLNSPLPLEHTPFDRLVECVRSGRITEEEAITELTRRSKSAVTLPSERRNKALSEARGFKSFNLGLISYRHDKLQLIVRVTTKCAFQNPDYDPAELEAEVHAIYLRNGLDFELEDGETITQFIDETMKKDLELLEEEFQRRCDKAMRTDYKAEAEADRNIWLRCKLKHVRYAAQQYAARSMK